LDTPGIELLEKNTNEEETGIFMYEYTMQEELNQMFKQMFPAEILNAPIWVAWGAVEKTAKGKVAKTLVSPRGTLSFFAGWQNEDSGPCSEAMERLKDAYESSWIAAGLGIHNTTRAEVACIDVDGVSLEVAEEILAMTGGVLELSPSGNGYHIWGSARVDQNQSYSILVGDKVVGIEVIGAKGKWCTVTGNVVGGEWGQLAIPTPTLQSRGAGGAGVAGVAGVAAPAHVLKQAFLDSSEGARHDALYRYCRSLQATLLALETPDPELYYAAVAKTVKSHPEFDASWKWHACAQSVWNSPPYSETVEVKRVQTGAVFETISKEEALEQAQEVRDMGAKAEPSAYWDLVAEEYNPVRVMRDIFLDQVAFEEPSGAWRWVDCREVRAVLRAKLRKMSKEERAARGLLVEGADDFLMWWTRSIQNKGIRATIGDWDGRDRLAELAGALKCKDVRISKACCEYFIKDWAVKVWAKLFNSEITNRMILLQGGQGIGKDSWAITLAGGFGANFGVPALMSAKMLSEQTLARVVSDKAVCLFDEFDKLAGAEALIKSLITKRHFDLEVKYENNPAKIDHRCSYIGTTNSSVFNDATGNRRFLFFELDGSAGEAIRFCFPAPEAKESMPYRLQILAQSLYLYRANGDMPLKENEQHEATMRAVQADVTPEDAGVDVVESVIGAIEQKIAECERFGQVWKRFFTPSELAGEFQNVARAHGLSISQVKQTYKRAGGFKQIKRLGLPKRLYSTPDRFESSALIEQYFEQSDIPF
jgi:hypothetical protein